jgi:hypothetical protein
VAGKSAGFWTSVRDFDAKLDPPSASGKLLEGDARTEPVQSPHHPISIKRLR